MTICYSESYAIVMKLSADNTRWEPYMMISKTSRSECSMLQDTLRERGQCEEAVKVYRFRKKLIGGLRAA